MLWFVAILLASPLHSQTETMPPGTFGRHAGTLIIDGKAYVRLGKRQLETIIVGGQVAAVSQTSPHEVVMIFARNRTYEKYLGGDLSDTGTYAVKGDSIWVRGPSGELVQRAFFQATDGELMMATRVRDETRWTKVTAKPL